MAKTAKKTGAPGASTQERGAKKKRAAKKRVAKSAATKKRVAKKRVAKKRPAKKRTGARGRGRAARTNAKAVAGRVATGAARESVVVENVNWPGRTHRVDAAKYRAAKDALLRVLPKKGGLTQAEMVAAVRAALTDPELRAKAGWWTKCVQLDLEAKRVVLRDGKSPLRWRRA